MRRARSCAGVAALAVLPVLAVLVALPLLRAQGQVMATKREILPLAEEDRQRLEEQRARVAELARRHVGRPTGGGSTRDLRTLQELLDAEVLRRDQVYGLQAMGVVLGDVMARELGLEWVVVVDEYGRSRALRSLERDELVFPVTMISKRVAAGIPVDVRKLYDSITASFASPR